MMRGDPPSASAYTEPARTRPRGGSSSSASSSTSSSLLNVSAKAPRFGGVFSTFWRAPSEQRERRRRKKQKARIFFATNSSSSSVNSDLAYGRGYIERDKSQGPTPAASAYASPAMYRNEPAPTEVRQQPPPPPEPRPKTDDEEILEIGRQLQDIARRQNESDKRAAGKSRASQLAGAAGIAGAAAAFGHFRNHKAGGKSQAGPSSKVQESSSDDDWESASEDESSTDSSDSSDGGGLAYGFDKPSKSARISAEPPEQIQPPGRKNTVVDPRLFGPYNSLRGAVKSPCGFGEQDDPRSAGSFRRHHEETVAQVQSPKTEKKPVQQPMQHVYPVPTSDPDKFDFDRASVTASRQDLPQQSRPAPVPVPLQQPKPIVPVSSKVYDADRYVEPRTFKRQTPTGRSPGRIPVETAIAGAGAAAAAIGVAMANRRDSADHVQRHDERRSEAWERRDHARESRDSRRPDERVDQPVKIEMDDRERRDRSERRSYRHSPVEIIDQRDKNRTARGDAPPEPTKKPEARPDARPDARPEVYRLPKGDEIRVEYDPEEDRQRREKPKEPRKEERKPEVVEERRDAKRVEKQNDLPRDHHGVEQPEVPFTQAPIDPFQFQVADDAFQTPKYATPKNATPKRPLTPQVVTVDREPNFDDSPPRKPDYSDSRMSRKDSFELEQRLEHYQQGFRDRSRTPEPRRRRDSFEEEKHAAKAIYDEVKHATAPVAAAALASAIAVEEQRSRKHRSEHVTEDGSRSSSQAARDAVQEEADRHYRETVLARKIAEDEIRSRSSSPHDGSVVGKYDDDKRPEVVTIVTPPEMDHPHDKSPYDAPNADVRIDHVIIPDELARFRLPEGQLGPGSTHIFRSRDPSCERERPQLNLVLPTPNITPRATPAPEQQKEADREARQEEKPKKSTREVPKPRSVEVTATPADIAPEVVPEPKQKVVERPTTPTAKSVTWGENETKSFEIESPEPPKSVPSSTSPKKSKKRFGKSTPWGVIAAAIGGAGAAAAATSEVHDPFEENKTTEDRERHSPPQSPKSRAVEPSSEPIVSPIHPKVTTSFEDDLPPAPGPKPSSPQTSQMPGAFADDLEFASVLAAGLQDTGFDPNIVIDNPTYMRRDSPPGQNEPIYQQPYVETVNDLGIYGPENIGQPTAAREPGHVISEVQDTPVEKDLKNGHAAFDTLPRKYRDKGKSKETEALHEEPAGDESEPGRKLSKKEKRKQKAAKRQSVESAPEETAKAVTPLDPFSQTAPEHDWNDDRSQSPSTVVSTVVSVGPKVRDPLDDPLWNSPSFSHRDRPVEEPTYDSRRYVDEPTYQSRRSDEEPTYDYRRSADEPTPRRQSEERRSPQTTRSLDDSPYAGTSFDELPSIQDTRSFDESSSLYSQPSEVPSSYVRSRDEPSSQAPASSETPKADDDAAAPTKLSKKEKKKKRSSRSDIVVVQEDGKEPQEIIVEEPRSYREELPEHNDTAPTEPREKDDDPLDSPVKKKKKSKKSKQSSDEWTDVEKQIEDVSAGGRSSPTKPVDDWDDRPAKSRRDRSRIDDQDTGSVVSDSTPRRSKSDRRSNGSRYEEDDAKSVASDGSGRKRRSRDDKKSVKDDDKKSTKEEEKRGSSGFFSLFRPGSGNKDTSGKEEKSFLDNAGTLGAGAGLASAVAALGSMMSRSNATEPQPEESEHSRSLERTASASSDVDILDPEITQRTIRPAIDPQYGDLLPLPPSPMPPSTPGSPTEELDDLPALPDSRPETPPEERRRQHEMKTHVRRRSNLDTPHKSPSQTAVPFKLRLGQRSSPSSPGNLGHAISPMTSPTAPTAPENALSRRPSIRPFSWESSKEIKPLYLLEQARQEHAAQSTEPHVDFPGLPPSEPSSRESPAPQFALRENDVEYLRQLQASPFEPDELRVNTDVFRSPAARDQFSSQETTPNAEQALHHTRAMYRPESPALPVVPDLNIRLELSGRDLAALPVLPASPASTGTEHEAAVPAKPSLERAVADLPPLSDDPESQPGLAEKPRSPVFLPESPALPGMPDAARQLESFEYEPMDLPSLPASPVTDQAPSPVMQFHDAEDFPALSTSPLAEDACEAPHTVPKFLPESPALPPVTETHRIDLPDHYFEALPVLPASPKVEPRASPKSVRFAPESPALPIIPDNAEGFGLPAHYLDELPALPSSPVAEYQPVAKGVSFAPESPALPSVVDAARLYIPEYDLAELPSLPASPVLEHRDRDIGPKFAPESPALPASPDKFRDVIFPVDSVDQLPALPGSPILEYHEPAPTISYAPESPSLPTWPGTGFRFPEQLETDLPALPLSPVLEQQNPPATTTYAPESPSLPPIPETFRHFDTPAYNVDELPSLPASPVAEHEAVRYIYAPESPALPSFPGANLYSPEQQLEDLPSLPGSPLAETEASLKKFAYAPESPGLPSVPDASFYFPEQQLEELPSLPSSPVAEDVSKKFTFAPESPALPTVSGAGFYFPEQQLGELPALPGSPSMEPFVTDREEIAPPRVVYAPESPALPSVPDTAIYFQEQQLDDLPSLPGSPVAKPLVMEREEPAPPKVVFAPESPALPSVQDVGFHFPEQSLEELPALPSSPTTEPMVMDREGTNAPRITFAPESPALPPQTDFYFPEQPMKDLPALPPSPVAEPEDHSRGPTLALESPALPHLPDASHQLYASDHQLEDLPALPTSPETLPAVGTLPEPEPVEVTSKDRSSYLLHMTPPSIVKNLMERDLPDTPPSPTPTRSLDRSEAMAKVEEESLSDERDVALGAVAGGAAAGLATTILGHGDQAEGKKQSDPDTQSLENFGMFEPAEPLAGTKLSKKAKKKKRKSKALSMDENAAPTEAATSTEPPAENAALPSNDNAPVSPIDKDRRQSIDAPREMPAEESAPPSGEVGTEAPAEAPSTEAFPSEAAPTSETRAAEETLPTEAPSVVAPPDEVSMPIASSSKTYEEDLPSTTHANLDPAAGSNVLSNDDTPVSIVPRDGLPPPVESIQRETPSDDVVRGIESLLSSANDNVRGEDTPVETQPEMPAVESKAPVDAEALETAPVEPSTADVPAEKKLSKKDKKKLKKAQARALELEHSAKPDEERDQIESATEPVPDQLPEDNFTSSLADDTLPAPETEAHDSMVEVEAAVADADTGGPALETEQASQLPEPQAATWLPKTETTVPASVPQSDEPALLPGTGGSSSAPTSGESKDVNEAEQPFAPSVTEPSSPETKKSKKKKKAKKALDLDGEVKSTSEASETNPVASEPVTPFPEQEVSAKLDESPSTFESTAPIALSPDAESQLQHIPILDQDDNQLARGDDVADSSAPIEEDVEKTASIDERTLESKPTVQAEEKPATLENTLSGHSEDVPILQDAPADGQPSLGPQVSISVLEEKPVSLDDDSAQAQTAPGEDEAKLGNTEDDLPLLPTLPADDVQPAQEPTSAVREITELAETSPTPPLKDQNLSLAAENEHVEAKPVFEQETPVADVHADLAENPELPSSESRGLDLEATPTSPMEATSENVYSGTLEDRFPKGSQPTTSEAETAEVPAAESGPKEDPLSTSEPIDNVPSTTHSAAELPELSEPGPASTQMPSAESAQPEQSEKKKKKKKKKSKGPSLSQLDDILSMENTPVQTPTTETPPVVPQAAETPLTETPAVETPLVDNPVVETPIVETPTGETTVETPAVVDNAPVEIPAGVEFSTEETTVVVETPAAVETQIIETPAAVETPTMAGAPEEKALDFTEEPTPDTVTSIEKGSNEAQGNDLDAAKEHLAVTAETQELPSSTLTESVVQADNVSPLSEEPSPSRKNEVSQSDATTIIPQDESMEPAAIPEQAPMAEETATKEPDEPETAIRESQEPTNAESNDEAFATPPQRPITIETEDDAPGSLSQEPTLLDSQIDAVDTKPQEPFIEKEQPRDVGTPVEPDSPVESKKSKKKKKKAAAAAAAAAAALQAAIEDTPGDQKDQKEAKDETITDKGTSITQDKTGDTESPPPELPTSGEFATDVKISEEADAGPAVTKKGKKKKKGKKSSTLDPEPENSPSTSIPESTADVANTMDKSAYVSSPPREPVSDEARFPPAESSTEAEPAANTGEQRRKSVTWAPALGSAANNSDLPLQEAGHGSEWQPEAATAPPPATGELQTTEPSEPEDRSEAESLPRAIGEEMQGSDTMAVDEASEGVAQKDLDPESQAQRHPASETTQTLPQQHEHEHAHDIAADPIDYFPSSSGLHATTRGATRSGASIPTAQQAYFPSAHRMLPATGSSSSGAANRKGGETLEGDEQAEQVASSEADATSDAEHAEQAGRSGAIGKPSATADAQTGEVGTSDPGLHAIVEQDSGPGHDKSLVDTQNGRMTDAEPVGPALTDSALEAGGPQNTPVQPLANQDSNPKIPQPLPSHAASSSTSPLDEVPSPRPRPRPRHTPSSPSLLERAKNSDAGIIDPAAAAAASAESRPEDFNLNDSPYIGDFREHKAEEEQHPVPRATDAALPGQTAAPESLGEFIASEPQVDSSSETVPGPEPTGIVNAGSTTQSPDETETQPEEGADVWSEPATPSNMSKKDKKKAKKAKAAAAGEPDDVEDTQARDVDDSPSAAEPGASAPIESSAQPEPASIPDAASAPGAEDIALWAGDEGWAIQPNSKKSKKDKKKKRAAAQAADEADAVVAQPEESSSKPEEIVAEQAPPSPPAQDERSPSLEDAVNEHQTTAETSDVPLETSEAVVEGVPEDVPGVSHVPDAPHDTSAGDEQPQAPQEADDAGSEVPTKKSKKNKKKQQQQQQQSSVGEEAQGSLQDPTRQDHQPGHGESTSTPAPAPPVDTLPADAEHLQLSRDPQPLDDTLPEDSSKASTQEDTLILDRPEDAPNPASVSQPPPAAEAEVPQEAQTMPSDSIADTTVLAEDEFPVVSKKSKKDKKKKKKGLETPDEPIVTLATEPVVEQTSPPQQTPAPESQPTPAEVPAVDEPAFEQIDSSEPAGVLEPDAPSFSTPMPAEQARPLEEEEPISPKKSKKDKKKKKKGASADILAEQPLPTETETPLASEAALIGQPEQMVMPETESTPQPTNVFTEDATATTDEPQTLQEEVAREQPMDTTPDDEPVRQESSIHDATVGEATPAVIAEPSQHEDPMDLDVAATEELSKADVPPVAETALADTVLDLTQTAEAPQPVTVNAEDEFPIPEKKSKKDKKKSKKAQEAHVEPALEAEPAVEQSFREETVAAEPEPASAAVEPAEEIPILEEEKTPVQEPEIIETSQPVVAEDEFPLPDKKAKKSKKKKGQALEMIEPQPSLEPAAESAVNPVTERSLDIPSDNVPSAEDISQEPPTDTPADLNDVQEPATEAQDVPLPDADTLKEDVALEADKARSDEADTFDIPEGQPSSLPLDDEPSSPKLSKKDKKKKKKAKLQDDSNVLSATPTVEVPEEPLPNVQEAAQADITAPPFESTQPPQETSADLIESTQPSEEVPADPASNATSLTAPATLPAEDSMEVMPSQSAEADVVHTQESTAPQPEQEVPLTPKKSKKDKKKKKKGGLFMDDAAVEQETSRSLPVADGASDDLPAAENSPAAEAPTNIPSEASIPAPIEPVVEKVEFQDEMDIDVEPATTVEQAPSTSTSDAPVIVTETLPEPTQPAEEIVPAAPIAVDQPTTTSEPKLESVNDVPSASLEDAMQTKEAAVALPEDEWPETLPAKKSKKDKKKKKSQAQNDLMASEAAPPAGPAVEEFKEEEPAVSTIEEAKIPDIAAPDIFPDERNLSEPLNVDANMGLVREMERPHSPADKILEKQETAPAEEKQQDATTDAASFDPLAAWTNEWSSAPTKKSKKDKKKKKRQNQVLEDAEVATPQEDDITSFKPESEPSTAADSFNNPPTIAEPSDAISTPPSPARARTPALAEQSILSEDDDRESRHDNSKPQSPAAKDRAHSSASHRQDVNVDADGSRPASPTAALDTSRSMDLPETTRSSLDVVDLGAWDVPVTKKSKKGKKGKKQSIPVDVESPQNIDPTPTPAPNADQSLAPEGAENVGYFDKEPLEENRSASAPPPPETASTLLTPADTPRPVDATAPSPKSSTSADVDLTPAQETSRVVHEVPYEQPDKRKKLKTREQSNTLLPEPIFSSRDIAAVDLEDHGSQENNAVGQVGTIADVSLLPTSTPDASEHQGPSEPSVDRGVSEHHPTSAPDASEQQGHPEPSVDKQVPEHPSSALDIAASYLEHKTEHDPIETTRATDPEKQHQDTGSSKLGVAAGAAAIAAAAATLAKSSSAKKKGKKSKYADKRSSQEDDLFDDPSLWEGADKKHVSEAANAEVEKFWGGVEPQSASAQGAPAEPDTTKDEEHHKRQDKTMEEDDVFAPNTKQRDGPPIRQNPVESGELPSPKEKEELSKGMPSLTAPLKEKALDDNVESPVLGREEKTEEIPSATQRDARQSLDPEPSTMTSDLDEAVDRGFEAESRRDLSSVLSSRSPEPFYETGGFRSPVPSILPPVQEEAHEEAEPQPRSLPKTSSRRALRTPEPHRDSALSSGSSHPFRKSGLDSQVERDSGVMRDWQETSSQGREAQRTPELSSHRERRRSREAERAKSPSVRDLIRRSPFAEDETRDYPMSKTPVLRDPGSRQLDTPTPEPHKMRRISPELERKRSKYQDLASAALAGAAISSTSSPRSTPPPGNRSVSERVARLQSPAPVEPPVARRSISNSSLSRHRRAMGSQTPEPLKFRPESPGIISRPATATPPLRRRTDRRMSGDLRSLSQRSQQDLTQDPTSSSNTPVANEGRVRTKDMADVFDGFGEGRIGSPRSPTRPHSMRRRQSMQVLELESRVEQLLAENRMLADARTTADTTTTSNRASASGILAERDAEIDVLKQSLEFLQKEVARLTEVNEGLNSANAQLAAQHNERYRSLETQHADTSRQLDEVRNEHGRFQESLSQKDAEISKLRSELDAAKDKIRQMQRQILAAKGADADFLNVKDVDHFDHRCQQLCSHVQQWVLRFSKFSDMRACRLTNEINDEKVIDRLDNAILDGTDVDAYLADRVRRRDVFMSMTMNMIWEFVFTRYLFGMDREQRQKLKSLEKLLTEVGPPQAVRQWRAVTLTLLSKRPSFKHQRDLDTEAVVQAIFQTLSKVLPPPSNLEDQIQSQLRRVMREAVDLSIEMRTQRAEYMMLPPLQPEYDADGELAETVTFNAALMNERSGDKSLNNESLEGQHAVVRIVLFPLVVKKGDDAGNNDDEIVVCPAQVLVARPKGKSVRLFTPGSEVGGSVIGGNAAATHSELSMGTFLPEQASNVRSN
ncbi:Deleted in azoospermia protein 2 [Colletotrichum sp. SAR 10_76]|nr:Deleted in azoospermia protein 2 [Colletotrichum sp. SAR 10_76]